MSRDINVIIFCQVDIDTCILGYQKISHGMPFQLLLTSLVGGIKNVDEKYYEKYFYFFKKKFKMTKWNWPYLRRRKNIFNTILKNQTQMLYKIHYHFSTYIVPFFTQPRNCFVFINSLVNTLFYVSMLTITTETRSIVCNIKDNHYV